MHELYGFYREVLYRQHGLKNGREVDVVGTGLLGNDWSQRREAMA